MIYLYVSGIGIGYTILNGLVCIYYNVIIALSLYYLFSSMQAQLPWGSCGHEWNTPTCGHPSQDGKLYTPIITLLFFPLSLPASFSKRCYCGDIPRSSSWVFKLWRFYRVSVGPMGNLSALVNGTLFNSSYAGDDGTNSSLWSNTTLNATVIRTSPSDEFFK